MRLIRPTTLTSAMVTACNVPETEIDTPAYAAGTTYALGDYVSVADSYNLTFYRSLQAANTGNTPASSPTWWEAVSTGYLAWNSGTTYAVGDVCTSNHVLYECLVINTNMLPDDNSGAVSPKWMSLGASNRWKMFDDKTGSKTTFVGTVTVSIIPGVIDSIAFLDLTATEIKVSMTDPIEGLVFPETGTHEIINLISESVVVDAYTYFFEPIITADSAVLLGLPPYGNATIDIEISNAGGTAEIGTVVLGMQKELGATQYNPSIGINDYSKKDVDGFGNYVVIQRAFSKRISCDFVVTNNLVDDLVKTLSTYRTTPVVWVGSDAGLSSMIIYGFYKSFQVNVPYFSHSTCTIEIEGLT